MIHLHAGGHLVRDPRERQTKAGKTYTAAMLAVEDGLIINVAVFDADLCNILTRCKKGDGLSVSGKATVGTYTDKEGQVKPSVGITANRILTSGAKATAKPRQRRQDHRQDDPRPFDDPIGF